VLMKHLVVVFAAVLLWSVGAVAEDCTVNVYRPKDRNYGYIRMGVNVDGVKLANLKDGETAQLQISCGKHVLSTPKSGVRVVLTFEQGAEYWLRVDKILGLTAFNPTFDLVSKDRAEAELAVAPKRS
jgi:hypothetical protein